MSWWSCVLVTVAIGLSLIAGHSLLKTVNRSTALFWFERWAIAYLLGIAALSGLWFLSSPLFAWIDPLWLMSAACVVMVLMARFGHDNGRSPIDDEPSPIGPVEMILAGIVALECAALFGAALRTSLGFDAVFNFEWKARMMFDEAGRFPLEYLSDGSRNWSHPQYPLMIPFAELWIYKWLGRVDQAAVKLLFPLFYMALVALACGALRRAVNTRIALAAAGALGLMPPLTLLPGAASGYADVPLAAASLGAVSFGYLALKTGARDAALIAGLMGAVAAWTKVEGLVLAGCVAAFVALGRALQPPLERRLAVRDWLAVALIPAVLLAPWLWLQRTYGIPAADFLALNLSNAYAGAHRIPVIIDLVARELLRPGHWGLLWPAWLVGTIMVVTRRRIDGEAMFLIGVVAAPLAIYVVPFIFSSWPDAAEHVRTALPRLLVPLAPIALVFSVSVFSREWWPPEAVR